jgi:methylenetetrahydrofolate dehydrogenase (NADP+)/methenyltetrahydrofolate cyclohydrolase/formyltetrahydrofolate synthetase
MVRKAALEAGAADCVISEVFAKGGQGGAEFARALVEACEKPRDFKFTYEVDQPIRKKVEAIAQKVYGAAGVEFSEQAGARIDQFEKAGFGNLPVCMAKTQYSFSHDPALLGAPSGYTLPVKDARLSAGAGFVYMLCGDMMTMPGLAKRPGGENIDIDEQGNIVGMF